MKVCPTCSSKYGDDIEFCFRDGSPLALQEGLGRSDPSISGANSVVDPADLPEPIFDEMPGFLGAAPDIEDAIVPAKSPTPQPVEATAEEIPASLSSGSVPATDPEAFFDDPDPMGESAALQHDPDDFFGDEPGAVQVDDPPSLASSDDFFDAPLEAAPPPERTEIDDFFDGDMGLAVAEPVPPSTPENPVEDPIADLQATEDPFGGGDTGAQPAVTAAPVSSPAPTPEALTPEAAIPQAQSSDTGWEDGWGNDLDEDDDDDELGKAKRPAWILPAAGAALLLLGLAGFAMTRGGSNSTDTKGDIEALALEESGGGSAEQPGAEVPNEKQPTPPVVVDEGHPSPHSGNTGHERGAQHSSKGVRPSSRVGSTSSGGSGYLIVRSNRDGVKLQLDGSSVGSVPLSKEVKAGIHTVVASYGGQRERRTVTVKADGAETLVIDFAEASSSGPPEAPSKGGTGGGGANTTVAGSPWNTNSGTAHSPTTGSTATTTATTTGTTTATTAGTNTGSATATSNPWGGASTAATGTGTLSVFSYPNVGAQVLVNGSARGVTPLTGLSLAAGTYSVQVKQGEQVVNRSVTVRAGQETRESFPIN